MMYFAFCNARQRMAVLMLGLLGISISLSLHATSSDPYFLSWSQKAELIKSGYIEEDNRWYNVHLAPGYTGPWRYSSSHWAQAGDDLSGYGDAATYRELYRTSRDVYRWGAKSSMMSYAVQGSSDAWKSYLGTAHERTERRIFGWWLAYPWAVLKGTANTGWRYLMGTTGMAGAFATGTVLVPVVYVTEPVVSAMWHAGVDGVVLPVGSAGWNTIVSPPLAMFGQRPAPKRVDGFWVSITENPYLALEEIAPASAEAIAEITQLSDVLAGHKLAPAESSDEALRQLEQQIRQTQERLDALNAERNAFVNDLTVRREQAMTEKVLLWQQQQANELAQRDLRVWWLLHRPEVLRQLKKSYGRDGRVRLQQLDQVLGKVARHSSADGLEGTTDPLREVISEGGTVLNSSW